MSRGVVLLILITGLIQSIEAQDRISREEYIEMFADIAMENMKRTGIPASITLAQGCLESDNGNSRLAVKGKNHFGIKCHDWEGRKIYHDDDEKDECFRVYRNDEESYFDHSEFLTTKQRYSFLFDLKPDDYKGWAKGLKKAGYATSKKYADLLISIIEANELYVYDEEVLKGGSLASRDRRQRNRDKESDKLIEAGDTAPGSGREIFTNNRVEYIIAREGDTWTGLREELDMYKKELYRYNNIENGLKPEEGMIVYLQPKRWRAEKEYDRHILEEGETLWDVSQEYAVKMKCLYRLNGITEGDEVEPGTEIYLRKKKPSAKEKNKERQKEQSKEAPVKLEFSDF